MELVLLQLYHVITNIQMVVPGLIVLSLLLGL